MAHARHPFLSLLSSALLAAVAGCAPNSTLPAGADGREIAFDEAMMGNVPDCTRNQMAHLKVSAFDAHRRCECATLLITRSLSPQAKLGLVRSVKAMQSGTGTMDTAAFAEAGLARSAASSQCSLYSPEE